MRSGKSEMRFNIVNEVALEWTVVANPSSSLPETVVECAAFVIVVWWLLLLAHGTVVVSVL